MKKLLFILAIAFGSTSLYGQHFDIRGYGGVNFMQLSTDQGTTLINGVLHNQSVSGRPGYQYGVAVTFGGQFFVQPGFQRTTFGTEIVSTNPNTGDSYTDQTTLSAISVPLKVGFRIINPESENWINVRIFGGIDGHHITTVNHSQNNSNTGTYDESDYQNIIMNADFGLGLDLFFLYVDAGYQMGLSPVHSNGDQAKMNAFYANVGLRISL